MNCRKPRGLAFWKWLAVGCVVPAVLLFVWPPSRIGGVFFGALAVCAAGEYFALKCGQTHRALRALAVIGQVLFALFVTSFVLVQGVILRGMSADPQADTADAVLVLGARVYESGVPSATLVERLDIAKIWLGAHPAAIAVLCGGQGDNEPFPEARAMQEYLLARGVPPERLVLEDASSNTIQNIANAKALLDSRFPQGYTTAVISSDFHLARARRLMQHAALDPYAVPAKTPYFRQRIALHLREYGSVMGLVLTGRW